MAISRGYVGNHKLWDEMGRITPNVEWSESHRPHFETTPASWLPVQREEKELQYYIVISSGKVVAEDRLGNLVPAGLRKAWNVASGTAALSYTATDVTEGVINLTTGVAVTAAVTYTQAQLTNALRERGLIRHGEYAMDFISKPIGIASYNYYQAAGTDTYNPANLRLHNFRPQAHVAITCDYAITLPVLPALAATETMANDNTGGATGVLEDFFDGTTATRVAGWFTSAQIHAVTRYASTVAANANIVGYMFVNYPVAHITEDSPITASVAGLVNEVDSLSAISAAGDYFLDYEVGMLFLYEAGGNAIPSPFSTAATISYYHYGTTGVGTNTVSTYACATGNLEYGDILTYDAYSNMVKATLAIATAEGYVAADGEPYTTAPDYDTATDAIISRQIECAVQNYTTGIVGQVIGVTTFGTGRFSKDYLDRVHTAYAGQTAANMQTPGSATGGRTDQLTYANAAERMVIINLILR
jgi:hypothetical protein